MDSSGTLYGIYCGKYSVDTDTVTVGKFADVIFSVAITVTTALLFI